MTENAPTRVELNENRVLTACDMKVSKTSSWVRDYGTKVLSERPAGVINPSEAEMNAIVKDLRS